MKYKGWSKDVKDLIVSLLTLGVLVFVYVYIKLRQMEKANKNGWVDALLVLGICYLISNGWDGWGWLILILILRNG